MGRAPSGKPLSGKANIRVISSCTLLWLFLTFLIIPLLNTQYAFGEDPRQFRCGVIVALTGSVADWGTLTKNSIEIAREHSPSSRVSFSYEDDQFTPKNAVSIAQRFLSVDQVSCLVTLGSSTSMAVQALAEKARVPLFAVALNPKVGEGLSFVFRIYVPINRQVEAFSKELSRRTYQRIASITATHDATIALRDALLEKKVINPVALEEVPVGETDMAVVAVKIIKSRPDAVFLNMVPPQPSTLARRLRELGYRGEFFAGPLLESQEEITAAAGTLEGAWFVTVNNANAKSFNEEYRQRYGIIPGILSVYAYDIATIIIRGYSTGDVIQYARSLRDFDGLAGRYGWNGTIFDIPAAAWVIKGKEFERIGD